MLKRLTFSSFACGTGHDVDQLMDETIKGAFYYIYSSLPSLTSADVLSDNKFYGLSPGGLPNGKNGSDYYGHVFWDMVWSFLLSFLPL